MKTACIHHSRDLDGWTSGAIVLNYFNEILNDRPDLKMIPYDYGQVLPDLSEFDNVIMCDVSFRKEEMLKLRAEKELVWIDHHISKINEMEGIKFKGIQDSKFAACELTWKYFYPAADVPKAVLLLGEYDSWRNQDKDHWENQVLPFQFGMRLHCNSAESFDKNYLTGIFSIVGGNEIIKQGNIVLAYQAQINETACRAASFECEFEGYKAIALNGGGFNSDVFKSVYDESKHDMMIPFQFNGKYWVVSLYTTKEIDCSLLAKKYDGGGHKKASGFNTNDVFKLLKIQ